MTEQNELEDDVDKAIREMLLAQRISDMIFEEFADPEEWPSVLQSIRNFLEDKLRTQDVT